jgi:hypothetical protein
MLGPQCVRALYEEAESLIQAVQLPTLQPVDDTETRDSINAMML